jgi:hypothetical protein
LATAVEERHAEMLKMGTPFCRVRINIVSNHHDMESGGFLKWGSPKSSIQFSDLHGFSMKETIQLLGYPPIVGNFHIMWFDCPTIERYDTMIPPSGN